MATRDPDDETLAFLARWGFERLAERLSWKRLDGAPLKPWDEQPEATRRAVIDAQRAAQHALTLLE